MIYPQKKENSLPSYLLMSLGLHIIVIALFSVLNPKFVQEQYTQITINIGGGQIEIGRASCRERVCLYV